MEVELELQNDILKIYALNYSKNHGARDLIGKKAQSLSVQRDNFLFKSSKHFFPLISSI